MLPHPSEQVPISDERSQQAKFLIYGGLRAANKETVMVYRSRLGDKGMKIGYERGVGRSRWVRNDAAVDHCAVVVWSTRQVVCDVENEKYGEGEYDSSRD